MKFKKYGYFSFSSIITFLCAVVFVTGLIMFILDVSKIVYSLNVPSKTFSVDAGNKILFITSGTETDSITIDQTRALVQEIDDLDSSFYIETFDADYLSYRKNFSDLEDRIQKKMSTYGKYDAVICADDTSLSFALCVQNELFSDTPIFFMECLDPNMAFVAGQNEWITGVYTELPIREIINSALVINPSATKVLAISDSSIPGRACSRQFERAVADFPGLDAKILDFSQYTMNSFSRKLRTVSKDTIVIYFGASLDYAGNRFTYEEISYVINSSIEGIPVYTPIKYLINKDFFAGYIVDFSESAKTIGRMVHDVLMNSLEMEKINIVLHEKSSFYVNFEQFSEMNLSEKFLPDDSVFLNYPLNFFTEYHQMIYDFILVFVSLLIMLIILAGALRVTVHTKKQMEFAATHDSLTGLYNRAAGIKFIAESQKKNKCYSVLLIDIDDFKRINDFHSHIIGDKILQEISLRIVNLMKEHHGMKACRFGGDEFGVLFEKHLDENSVEVLLLKNALNDSFCLGDVTVAVKVSMGIVNSVSSKSVDDIFTEVDLALNEAKGHGINSNKSVFFTEELKQIAIKRDEISKKLELACKKGEFAVFYQPQIDIASGEIHGYEALIRLKDLSYTPSEFIPVAEECGYISRLGRIVTEEVISQMAKWKAEGKKLYSVAVNFSSVQMGDVDYINFLQYMLEKYDISPSLLEIEITESLFFEDKNYAVELFNAFRNLGVKLSLDDFGTGYSSLSYLTFLPVDTVKIDKSIVDNYLMDESNSDFMKNIVCLVHGLGMKLTVEGIENRSQFEKLKTLDVDFVQGFYFSKPVSSDLVEKFTVDKNLL